MRRNSDRVSFNEWLIEILGSWPMTLTAVAATGWALWDQHRHAPMDGLDVTLSIVTYLFDIMILIGTNYRSRIDRRILREIQGQQRDHRLMLGLLRDDLGAELRAIREAISAKK